MRLRIALLITAVCLAALCLLHRPGEFQGDFTQLTGGAYLSNRCVEWDYCFPGCMGMDPDYTYCAYISNPSSVCQQEKWWFPCGFGTGCQNQTRADGTPCP